eukprot:GHVH01014112.1.p1 GENE.GHVH01014112.1~~GHVH01014112.1.p1  ORF type:complete len:396 (+),score=44.14 GHVH01014112.1:517-1704(+)
MYTDLTRNLEPRPDGTLTLRSSGCSRLDDDLDKYSRTRALVPKQFLDRVMMYRMRTSIYDHLVDSDYDHYRLIPSPSLIEDWQGPVGREVTYTSIKSLLWGPPKSFEHDNLNELECSTREWLIEDCCHPLGEEDPLSVLVEKLERLPVTEESLQDASDYLFPPSDLFNPDDSIEEQINVAEFLPLYSMVRMDRECLLDTLMRGIDSDLLERIHMWLLSSGPLTRRPTHSCLASSLVSDMLVAYCAYRRLAELTVIFNAIIINGTIEPNTDFKQLSGISDDMKNYRHDRAFHQSIITFTISYDAWLFFCDNLANRFACFIASDGQVKVDHLKEELNHQISSSSRLPTCSEILTPCEVPLDGQSLVDMVDTDEPDIDEPKSPVAIPFKGDHDNITVS